MKKLLLFVLLLISVVANAQKGISYQAVIIDPVNIDLPGEDITGQPLVNANVWVKFAIISGTTSQFVEVHQTKTDAYGLVNLTIGSVASTAFNAITWDATQKSLLVYVSFNNGASYTKVSEQKLSYIPYALFAETAGKLGSTLGIAGGGTGATTAVAARAKLGLGNVDNTSDADKPISTATQAALDLKANVGDLSAALAAKADTITIKAYIDTKLASGNFTSTKSSTATISDADANTKGKIQLAGDLAGTADTPTVPGLALKANVTDVSSLTTSVNANTASITANATALNSEALTARAAELVLTNSVSANTASITANAADLVTLSRTINANTISITANTSDISLKAPIASPTFTGTVSGITKSMVGLGSVNNTADADKPISTATQAALDLKANAADLTALATTVNANTASITANSAELVSLSSAVNTNTASITANTNNILLKAPLASPTFTGTVSGITKSMVDLGSVDNTADADKPISTAMQAALNLKANAADLTALTATVNANTASITANTSDISLKAPLNSPRLVTPDLGIPSAVTLTNGTGLPLTTGVTGILPIANGGTGLVSAGTSGQLLSSVGSGTLTWTSPSWIPYTGATGPVNLGAYDLTVNGLTMGVGSGNITSSTAFGEGSLRSNTIGIKNTALGNSTLNSNTIGSQNTAIGYNSLANNVDGNYNTAIGLGTLFANIDGSYNTSLGLQALKNNIDGSQNTATGLQALFNNTSGGNNTSFGLKSLYNNSIGSGNVAVGYNALSTNTTGSNNTALGNAADVASNNLTNATAIGYGASVSADNTIQLGNSSVLYVRTSGSIYTPGISFTSDNRLKTDISPIDNALETILKLNPVDYKKKSTIEATAFNMKESGFIAQEILKVLPDIVTEGGDKDKLLSINYISIIPLLTKAIQEQQLQIVTQQKQIELLIKTLEEMKNK